MNLLKYNIRDICNIAIDAGLKIKEYYKKENKIYLKEDNSPLTQADLESNKIIVNELKKIDSSIPILTEESYIEWKLRKNWTQYWLVDPLDGTKEFINHNGEFTVNIALIKSNKPILGVIYAPELNLLYYASKNNGSFKLRTNKKINTLEKSLKISVNSKNKKDHLIVFGSRSHSNQKGDEWIKQNYNNYEIIKRGSSIKFCEIAEGKADLYVRLGPTSEWDIAAGHAILEEAGGNIQNIDNQKILYNCKENVINPNFIASCSLSS